MAANDQNYRVDRTEVRLRENGSHPGHVFPDGTKLTGARYRNNSAAFLFVRHREHEDQGQENIWSLFIFDELTKTQLRNQRKTY